MKAKNKTEAQIQLIVVDQEFFMFKFLYTRPNMSCCIYKCLKIFGENAVVFPPIPNIFPQIFH